MYSVNASALPRGQFENRIGSFVCLKKMYSAIVILIGLVSVYDAFLVYQYREVINEQNPFCAWLISLEPNYVSLFLVGKGLGTLSVMIILFLLFRHWSRLAIPVAASLMLFQVGLMGYLHGSDGRRPSVTQMAMLSSDTFPPLIAVSGKAVNSKRVKKIPRKSEMAGSAAASAGSGQQRLTKGQRRRLWSQRMKLQAQNKLVNPKNSNAKGSKAKRSKERVLNLKSH
ncbi:hypothetical protein N9B31_09715 [Mariniblastus sp.]|nr:hypothetical protein [Mariniblastus sp.]MDA7908901.1 hypothetical protein [bacterium]MDA7911816.1 hypothetical protein [bacterium]MDA7923826.1 hypothetical protein [Mariniblastus sp.]MDB4564579.1 hypothetical protein [Mariniblastus sp.]